MLLHFFAPMLICVSILQFSQVVSPTKETPVGTQTVSTEDEDAAHDRALARATLEKHEVVLNYLPPPVGVWQVMMGNERANKETLAALPRLTGEEYVWLYAANNELDVEELKLLGDIQNTINLNLNSSPITDQDLTEIARLKNLTRLSLCRTQITDRGLKNLATLTHLVDLRVDGTDIDGNGLPNLSKLPSLHTLSATRTKIGDKGLAGFKTLVSLRWLNLSYTSVSDEGLNELVALHNLQELGVVSTAVSDHGAEQFVVRHSTSLKEAIQNGKFVPIHNARLKVIEN